MGVSRELVRRWGENLNRPGDLHGLAIELDAPVAWLTHGGESALPANSHIGVRVGAETTVWREQLYSMTLAQLDDIPEAADIEFIQAHLEWAVFNNPEMATIARRSGDLRQSLTKAATSRGKTLENHITPAATR